MIYISNVQSKPLTFFMYMEDMTYTENSANGLP